MNKINNLVVEVLNLAHGKRVIEYFKSIGINTGTYEGTCTKENSHPNRFYGVINGSFYNYTLKSVIESGVNIGVLHPELIPMTGERLTNIESKKEVNMKITKTKEIKIGEFTRKVTVAVIVENNVVKTGYSVCMPEDKYSEDLAEKIATGRALKEKTNLTPDMEIGKGMDKKYILHAIADNTLKLIEGGKVVKGIKDTKKEENVQSN